jgi:hypothetical protein
MELATLVTLRPPEAVLALAGAELPEVLSRLGHHVCEELELDPSEGFSLMIRLSVFDNHVMDAQHEEENCANVEKFRESGPPIVMSKKTLQR